MKIQAITVSVNYDDFLEHVLEENHRLFDQWIIVTSLKDDKTYNICYKYKNVLCLRTDVFYENGAKFNKYAGINVAIQHLKNPDWVLFLDSDIVLHNQTRRILENLNLQKDCLYGIDRLNCVGLPTWKKFSHKRDLVIDNWMLTNANMPLGTRLVHYYGYDRGDGKFAGWNPLGFFQLAHSSAFNVYPQNSLGADHCDLMFARTWQRNRRVFIPEIMAIHLESKFAIKGTNWYGRISEPFSYEKKYPTLKYLLKLMLLKTRLLYKRFTNLIKRY